MPDASFRARYRLAGAAFQAALVRFGTLTLKYADDQPRVPAGSPDGGQWTSGANPRRVRLTTAPERN